MKILVIGSGGREHAIAWKLNQSPRVQEIYVAPGNAGTGQDFINVPIDVMDFDQLVSFAVEHQIDLVVVGPEDPLCQGITNHFRAVNIPIFGPDQESAKFEASKDYTKRFLVKYQIPTAQSTTVTSYEEALAYLNQVNYPLVIKADGLCKGKGVIIVQTEQEAIDTLKEILVDQIFADQGAKVVIEEFLQGEEESLICFVSNNRLVPMQTARDYKKIGEGDQGPNTGGVGAYSPIQVKDPTVDEKMKKILQQIEEGFQAEGFTFNGILFIGFMIEAGQPKVLEFNVRFGDPETEVLLPRLERDLVEVIEKTMAGDLQPSDLVWSDQISVGVILYSQGYPGDYQKGIIIDSLPDNLAKDQIIFHNGTALSDEGNFVTNGGRVLTAVSLADNLEQARQKAYDLVQQIQGSSLGYRRDIAQR